MSEARVRQVQVQITRWVSDDQPGFVEFLFHDRAMQPVIFVEKLPYVTAANLNAKSSFPQPGELACVCLGEHADESGLEYAEIDTEIPWDLASIDGRTRFLVSSSQLLPD